MEFQARRFLFQPRRWVRSLGRCAMQRAALQPSRFIVAHARVSLEKQQEGRRGSLPKPEAYARVAASLGSATNLTHAFVQTASPSALSALAAALLSGHRSLAPSWTNNTRSEHDNWGGRDASAAVSMESGVTAAVNLYIAAHAPLFVSLSASMWNHLVAALASSRPLTSPSNLASNGRAESRAAATAASDESRAELRYSDGRGPVEMVGPKLRWTHVHCGGSYTLSVMSHDADGALVRWAVDRREESLRGTRLCRSVNRTKP